MDILTLIQEDLGPPASHAGRWFFFRCPFHPDHDPSLGVTPDTGSWYCFGCGKGGGVRTWLRAYRKVSPPGKVGPPPRPTCKRSTPPPPAWQEAVRALLHKAPFPSGRALAWLQARGLREETLHAWGIRYLPHPVIQDGLFLPAGIAIPCTLEETLWAVKVRALQGTPKYRSVQGSQPTFFGLDRILPGLPLLLVESELDALLLHQEVPWVNAVALGSASAKPSLEALLYLLRSPTWYAALDADPAGARGTRWWQAFSPKVRTLPIPHGKDPAEFVQGGGDLQTWLAPLRRTP